MNKVLLVLALLMMSGGAAAKNSFSKVDGCILYLSSGDSKKAAALQESLKGNKSVNLKATDAIEYSLAGGDKGSINISLILNMGKVKFKADKKDAKKLEKHFQKCNS